MKRLFDLVIAFIIAVLMTPIILILVILIYIFDGKPIFFRQSRIGKDGKLFQIYKLRTMINGARDMGTGLFTYENDFRITKTGKFLRYSSMDELPQLINIFKGDMSIVGPRPPVDTELGSYDSFDSNLKKRFTVNPGITGYAQVYGRNSFDWETKIEYDNKYIKDFKKFGILIDIKILFLTPIALLKFSRVSESMENKNGKFEQYIK